MVAVRPTFHQPALLAKQAANMISRLCDAYVMHGDEPARAREKIADMSKVVTSIISFGNRFKVLMEAVKTASGSSRRRWSPH
jgi:hypothetical protein